MQNIRKAYHTILGDHFPDQMIIQFGESKLIYKKKTWKLQSEGEESAAELGLRYGENPDQEAALYELVNGNLVLGDCQFINPGNGLVSSISEVDMLQFGKHPGKINLTDIDAGLNILKYLMNKPAAVVLKHNNPSGAAIGETISVAFEKAFMADRLAAMGGVVVLNRAMDKASAELFNENYFEVIAAPDFEEGVVDILASRRNLRIVRIDKINQLAKFKTLRFVDFKSLIDGGIIVQQSPLNRIQSTRDFLPAKTTFKGKSYEIQRKPTQRELADMLFGWQVEQGVTSNSVLFAKDGATVGIGTGEQDRVGVAKIAAAKAKEKYADATCFKIYGIPLFMLELEIAQGKRSLEDREPIMLATQEVNGGLLGSVMVSDAFFPFRDGVDVGIEAGATAICHPGGSIRDFESITACNEANPKVTMVFTGQRTFKH
ncbi:IMP cyclohydrolase [candidate division KSB1 bacterium]|nr:IMP cyclohydrolase [candidate division KSB1 bacterium]